MRSALVIGNSDGIGLALTRRLLAEGWSVLGLSRSESPVRADAYVHLVLDVRDPEYASRLASFTEQARELDACVYCAGVGEFVDVESLTDERRVFETNLLGAVTTAQVVIPAMVRAGRGHLIGLSSQADSLVDSRAPSYAASKAGLSSYLEGLSLACRPRGVHVTNLRLGFVDTKMAKAPVRPFMISADEAAERVLRCLRTRPLRHTHPKSMAVLLWFLRLASSVRRWLA